MPQLRVSFIDLAVPFSLALLMAGQSAGPARAETVEIAGPAGPLSGEAIAVDNAENVVVIIPGSGPVDRDGNAPGTGLHSDTYRLLAQGLAQQGIASIRIDKRGFFSSRTAIGDPTDATIANYAEDALDWVQRARQLAPHVWIAGHSEGGLVALVAARKSPGDVEGLVLLATPGRPIGDILIAQLQAMPDLSPFMPEITRVVKGLESGRTSDPQTLPEALRGMFQPGNQRFMTDLFSYDPAAVAGQYQGAALIVQGDADIQIGQEDAERLRRAMPQAQTVFLPDATHMLKQDVPGQPLATYSDPELPLHPDLVEAISEFIGSQQ